MRLRSLNYAQFEGQPKQWRLEGLSLENVNLLVGKNASGKSRTLSVINSLALLLSRMPKVSFISGNYDAVFGDGEMELEYRLKYEQNQVTFEQFSLDGRRLLERGEHGIGRIWAEKNDDWMDFQAPEDQLAAVARQDSIQHSYFAHLHKWAQALYFYPFGTPLGHDRLAIIVKDAQVPFDPKDTGNVVAIFRRGVKDYGDRFKECVLSDMCDIGFPLTAVDTQPVELITITGPLSGPPVGLCVQEKALRGSTEQTDMSQGMFRSLSVIIQITYAQMSSTPGSVLIDDIGEGLDFERSCRLIKLLVSKAERSSVQLIMSTNDRFVMNAVSLEAWSVLRRSGGDSRVFNYRNSRAKFDEFKFTGMNNFDFFAADFLADGDDER